MDIVIRKGRPEDAPHFAEFVLMTSPTLLPTIFGSKVKELMRSIFRYSRHYYSFDRAFFIEVNGKVAGMAQFHRRRPRSREKVRFTFLLLKYLNWRLPPKILNLLKSERIISAAAGEDCYVSNVAVHPEYRSLGLGTRLLRSIEEIARNIGKKKIVLHAETQNTRAISLYERLGYKIERRSPTLRIKEKAFRSFKLVKPVV